MVEGCWRLPWSGPALRLRFLGLGLSNVAAFFAARYPQRHGEVLRATLGLALLCTVFIYSLGLIGSWVFARHNAELLAALSIAFLATPFALVTGIGRGMVNSIDLRLWSRLRLIQPVVYLAIVGTVAAFGALSVAAGAWAYFGSLLASTICVYWIIPSREGFATSAGYGVLRREMIRYGFKSSMARTAQVANVRFDIALLGVMLPASQVGLYAVASSLTQYVVPLSTAAAPWVFPRLARLGPSQKSMEQARRAVRITALLAIALALMLAGSAPFVLGNVLGPEWSEAVVPMWILLAGAVLQSIRFTLVSVASGFNRPELSAHSEGIAALVTVVLLWPMVQVFGLLGAAGVSVLAYGAGTLLLHRGINRAVGNSTVPTSV